MKILMIAPVALLAACASTSIAKQPLAADLEDQRYCTRSASILRMSDPDLNESAYAAMCVASLQK